MKKRQLQRLEMLFRVKQFVLDHPIVPAIPVATTLMNEVNTTIAAMNANGANQVEGFNTFRNGSSQRGVLAKDIRTTVSDIKDIAAGLDPVAHPGLRDQFRLGAAHRTYQGLLQTATAFVNALATPAVKAIFTDRGFPADFDVAFTAQVNAFAAATGVKYAGLQDRAVGTAKLGNMDRRTSIMMRELRAVMIKHLRAANPDLIPAWKAAARTYRDPAAAEAPTPPPPSGGSGS